jgi:hypothetical protein
MQLLKYQQAQMIHLDHLIALQAIAAHILFTALIVAAIQDQHITILIAAHVHQKA